MIEEINRDKQSGREGKVHVGEEKGRKEKKGGKKEEE